MSGHSRAVRRRTIAMPAAAIAVALLLRGRSGGGAVRARVVALLAPAARSRVQKTVSKLIYGFMNRAGPAPATAFINYGYAAVGPDEKPGAGAVPEDDPDRFGMALYDRVAAGAPLEGRGVLEVGCGRGGGAAFVFDGHLPRSMTALDLAQSAIDRARHEQGRAGLEFVQGDAEALPFGDASFDAVLNVESAHWYPDVDRFLAEVFRVLRPGGFLLLADVRDTDLSDEEERTLMPRSDMGAFVARLEESPFVIVEQEDITANVRRALELDTPRRRRLIETRFPRWLRSRAFAFSGVVGTPLYEALAGGEITYMRFVLQKA